MVPSRHHQQRILIHVDDDELRKNRPIRLKARDRPPTRKSKLEVGKREDSKLAKVRAEKHKGKE
jgi:hypothetical protein